VKLKTFFHIPLSVLSLLLLLSLSFSLFVTISRVSAASSYDSTIRTINPLNFEQTETGYTCPNQDLSNSWANFITNSSYWSHVNVSDQPAVQTSFNNKTAWAVLVTKRYNFDGQTDNTYRPVLTIIWSDNISDTSGNFNDAGSFTYLYLLSTSYHEVDVVYEGSQYGGNSCNLVVSYESGPSATSSSILAARSTLPPTTGTPYSLTNEVFLINDWNITYPSGYAGVTPPAQYSPMGNTHIEADVSGNSAAFTGTQLTPNSGVPKFEFDFTSGNGSAYVDYSVTNDPKVTYYSTDGYTIDHSTVNGEDSYSVQLIYNYDSAQTKKVYMRVTDGSGQVKVQTLTIKTGTTGTVSYVNDDTLQAQSDNLGNAIVCSTWDIPCYIGQGINSLWSSFTTLLQSLFVPSASQISDLMSSFSLPSQPVSSIITIPITTIATITTKTCTPLSLPLPFVNRSIILPCMTDIYINNFGAFFVLYQVITTAVISYYVIVNLFMHVKNFQSPKKDQIEVFRL
jgi:hypothetical protein